MVRAVVFDLWNTLVHSRGGDPFRHLKALLNPAQLERYPELRIDAMTRIHPDAASFLGNWRQELALNSEQDAEVSRVFQAAGQDAETFPEALEALARTRQVARLALLSNTQSFDMDFIERLGVGDLIPQRFLSAHTGLLKPDPAIFLHVQKKLGLFPGQIAMVGDSWSDDVKGALDAGWTAIWVNRAGDPRPEDVEPDADLVEIRDLGQVPEVVEALQAGARCSTCLG